MATFIIVASKAQGVNQLAKIIENGTETDFTLGVEVTLTQAQVDLLNAAGYNPVVTTSGVPKYPQPVSIAAVDPVPTLATISAQANAAATFTLTHDIKVAASPGGAGTILRINRLRGSTWSSTNAATVTATTSPQTVTMDTNGATGDIHWVEAVNGGGARFIGPKFTTP